MTTQPLLPDPDTPLDDEDLADGGGWLLDLVAAVDHLRRGYRPGLTVWDALEEALRWTHTEADTPEDDLWEHPDPLSSTLYTFIITTPVGTTPAALQAAVRRWVNAMGDGFNDGHHWPHPAARRGFPPPLQTIVTATEG